MDKLKWIILGIVVVIIIIITILFTMKNNNQEAINDEEAKSEQAIEQEENNNATNEPPSFTEEPGYIEYYTTLNCIDLYLGTINNDAIQQLGKEEINKRINELTSANASKNVNITKEKNIFVPIKVLTKTTGKVQSFLAYGALANLSMDYQGDAYFVVNLDTKNQTFSIEKLDGNYSDINQIKVAEIENIEKNDFNSFEYQELSEQYKYKQIFTNMKRLMLTKPEVAYEYLDNDYKAKRFGSYEEFLNYVKNNRNTLIGIDAKKHKINDDGTVLILQDQHSNRYRFELTGTMKYKARIDNYIVLNEEDIEKYNKLDNKEKVEYNIDRWFKMLKNKEFKCAYEFLDDTFRENNYPNLDDFKKSMEGMYSENYDIDVSDVKEEGNVFTAEVHLINSKEEFSDKYVNVVMRLDNDTDFTMSFEVE